MKQKIFFLLLIMCTSLIITATPPVEEGRAIFSARCASCHNINKVLTGPALAGVDQRRSMDWIINFVHSSQKLVKSGDPVAVELFNKFNKIPMPDHTGLSADKIKSVVEYIKSETKKADTKEILVKSHKESLPFYATLSMSVYITFAALFVLLVAVLSLAVWVKKYERRVAAEKLSL